MVAEVQTRKCIQRSVSLPVAAARRAARSTSRGTRSAGRLPRGARHARAAEWRRDFHIPPVRQGMRSGDRTYLQPIRRLALPSPHGVRRAAHRAERVPPAGCRGERGTPVPLSGGGISISRPYDKGCDREIAPTFSRSGDRRSLRRTACGAQHITKFSCGTRIYGCRGAEFVGGSVRGAFRRNMYFCP